MSSEGSRARLGRVSPAKTGGAINKTNEHLKTLIAKFDTHLATWPDSNMTIEIECGATPKQNRLKTVSAFENSDGNLISYPPMREFVAVNDPFTLLNMPLLKREALMFSRIAIPRLREAFSGAAQDSYYAILRPQIIAKRQISMLSSAHVNDLGKPGI